MTKLSGFVRTLPANWATCPIYAQGVELPKGGTACGKSPLGKTHHEDWSPEETALHIGHGARRVSALKLCARSSLATDEFLSLASKVSHEKVSSEIFWTFLGPFAMAGLLVFQPVRRALSKDATACPEPHSAASP